MDTPRLDDLRRRVRLDPASIAFAALAEELRRVGEYDEAIEVCRAGLQRHGSYLSARVTLGRALLDSGQLDSAREELESVVRSAPDNIAAARALADVDQRASALASPPLPPPPAERERIVLPGPRPAPQMDQSASTRRLEQFLAAIGAARRA
jgi:tetratricopeptide (TPR) repeat protein